MKLLTFAASARKDSFNKKLIHIAEKIATKMGHEIDHAEFEEFDLPLYNADVQAKDGIPPIAEKFVKRMHAADGVIISSPEYNFSIPGTLKNLIDWVSRIQPMPWNNQYILLMSASPSLVGGNRGLWAARIPLESCGSLIYPDMFSLSAAHEAFDEKNQLKNEELEKRLNTIIEKFTAIGKKIK